MSLNNLVNLSNKYGKNINYVLAGGGNTSFKTDKEIFVKASGTELSTITAEGFVKLDREKLSSIWQSTFSADPEVRESEVLEMLMGARTEGEQKRPSVETLLHDLIDNKYVLHLHPAKVNGLTCAKNAKVFFEKLFEGEAIWIDEINPGYILALACKEAIETFKEKYNKYPQIIILQNHGIFTSGNSIEEVESVFMGAYEKIASYEKEEYDSAMVDFSSEAVFALSEKLTNLSSENFAVFTLDKEIERICGSESEFSTILQPFTPDHIVYCKANPLLATEKTLSSDFNAYTEKYGYEPKVVFIKNAGMFTLSNSMAKAKLLRDIFIDAIKIAKYAASFGGEKSMSEDKIDFIKNWEVERYRASLSK